mmetsp:Transcript_11725/g.13790  ORF Transcript_11725/g.13790 Transcript_11725/m.13790 type:complete len:310 (+) Transcript_11725:58-987(+)
MKILSLLTISTQLSRADAFVSAINRIAFTNVETQHDTALFAEGGPPQYDKFDAVLQHAEVLAEGSVLVRVSTDANVDYQPGHVLALEIEGDTTNSDENEWMKGPYTVTRATDKSFDILMRTVGEKSKKFANAKSGTPLKFGGKFKVPIVEGIQKEDTKRVVFISTGVGVGPCIGAIEKALEDKSFPPIELFASYRTPGEIIYGTYLDELKGQYPGRLSSVSTVSSENGRLSGSVENLQAIISKEAMSLKDTHYHLIGNGQMVSEFKEGLKQAGVPKDKVTIEMYFNHKEPKNDDVVNRIAGAISASAEA